MSSNRRLRAWQVVLLVGLGCLFSPAVVHAAEQEAASAAVVDGAAAPPQAAAAPAATSLPAQSLGALRADMHDYFRREQRGGLVLMAMGAPAVALGAGLLVDSPDLLRGLAYPLLILGGVEFIGGLIFAARTPSQVRALDVGLSTRLPAALAAERARMRRVNRQFLLLQIVEVAVMTGGLALSVAGAASKNDTLTGVGLGLAIESTGLLIFDVFAAARAHRYTDSLQRDVTVAAPTMP